MPSFDAERRIEARQVQNRIDEVRETIYSDRRPIGNLQYCVTGQGKGPDRMPRSGWKPFRAQEIWGGFDQTTWFRMEVTVPASMKGHRVVALIRPADFSFIPRQSCMTEGGEALAYVNGKPCHGLDRNRDEIFLVERAKGGEKFEIVLEACPSTRFDLQHLFSYADIAVMHGDVWDFYWDCQVAYEVCQTLDSNFAPARHMTQLLYDTVMSVDLQHKGAPSYFESVRKAQRTLRTGLKAFETSYGMGKLVLAGHAHIDTAWLWPIRETKRKCARTFSTVLSLMERYPEFHFSCSQAVQYHWMKQYYPGIYKRIKERVKEGRWEICGAPWVEPDHNVPSGESLIRQYLLGNRFFQKEFGKRSCVAWVPDSFGYTWSLPQIMSKCGLKAFITTKIDWSVFTSFPYSMFNWEGADGTRILSVMPPLNYNGNPLPSECVAQWSRFKQKEHVEELPFAFGWGDGGGGPTMNMIEHGRRLRNIVGIPQVEFGAIEETVERMSQQCDRDTLPTYNGELYLELHRACQTTQARTKRNNRKCEFALRDAELLSTLAMLNGGEYDRETLNDAWRIVLTNQFHDILPGSSITEVYTTADKDYAEAKSLIQKVQTKATKHLLARIDTSGPGKAIVVFNSLSWVRSDVVVARMRLPKGAFAVLDPHGKAVPCQRVTDGALVFEARDLPPLGYSVYRLVTDEKEVESFGVLKASPKGMENDFLALRFDKYGRVTRVFDKIEQRECLEEGQVGNVLQLFDDRPFCHDAWDIDHNFDEIVWEPSAAERAEVIESGPVRAIVRFTRKTERSAFIQDVTMYAHSPRVDFVTRVDWHEKRTLLKVAFPVAVRSSSATFEIQYAAIERATHDNTAHDRARFEVAAQKWADLSEGNYGVSLLNDCKYGYDVKGHTLRLSLLRSSVDPDPVADEGEHEFTYALLPHPGDWRDETVQQGFELNAPLLAVEAACSEGPLPAAGSFAAVDVDHVVIDCVKRCEDSNAVIVRFYEAYGQRGHVALTFGRKPKKVFECNFVEEGDVAVSMTGAGVELFMKPFEVRCLKLQY